MGIAGRGDGPCDGGGVPGRTAVFSGGRAYVVPCGGRGRCWHRHVPGGRGTLAVIRYGHVRELGVDATCRQRRRGSPCGTTVAGVARPDLVLRTTLGLGPHRHRVLAICGRAKGAVHRAHVVRRWSRDRLWRRPLDRPGCGSRRTARHQYPGRHTCHTNRLHRAPLAQRGRQVSDDLRCCGTP